MNIDPRMNGSAPQGAHAVRGSIPKPENLCSDVIAKMFQSRAKLIVVLAGLMGQRAVLGDIVEALQADGPHRSQISMQTLAIGLKAARLTPDICKTQTLNPQHWPAIAQMTSGQHVLVLGQENSDFVIYDETCDDRRAIVPSHEFQSVFAGVLLRAAVSEPQLAQKHGSTFEAQDWFWSAFRPYYRQFGEVALGSLMGNILAVAVALFSLQVYDRVIPHQSQATLWVLAIGAFLAIGFEALLKLARARLVDGAGRQIEVAVQKLLMDRLLGMRSDAPQRAPSQLFSAMREFSSVREFFTATSLGSLADIPFVFVFLALVYSIAGNLVFVLILGAVIMVLPGVFLQRHMVRITREMQGASAHTNRVLHETLAELDTVKTQRAEARFQRVWGELTALSALKSSDQRKLASALTFWSQAVQQATYIAAVICCTYLVFAGAFSVGSIIAVGILTSRTLAPLTQLAATLSRWSNVKSALEGLNQIAEAPQDTQPQRSYLRREKTTGEIELREMQFRYPGNDSRVLDIPALRILPGQRFAILGSNGAGKSTLLKVLSGLYAPSQGSVLLDGTEMEQLASADLRRLIGYLGPEVKLFSGSLRDNLNLSQLENDDQRLRQALDFAGLGPFINGHPKGLDLPISDGGQGLSSGQRQSIGWARLWLQDPKVCLLDEPTAAIDQTLETTLISRLKGWFEGRTAIIATHRAAILSLTDRTTILHNGRLAADGPRDAVLEHLRVSAAQQNAKGVV